MCGLFFQEKLTAVKITQARRCYNYSEACKWRAPAAWGRYRFPGNIKSRNGSALRGSAIVVAQASQSFEQRSDTRRLVETRPFTLGEAVILVF